jgi:hypothetical protein
MDHQFLKLCSYILFIFIFTCGIGCLNYLYIALTGKSFIYHKILLYIFGIIGIIIMIFSIWCVLNVNTIL